MRANSKHAEAEPIPDRPTVVAVFGTRPEVIKLAPVLRALSATASRIRTITVASGQHTSLLYPFVQSFGIGIDHDFHIMEAGQHPNGVCSRILNALDQLLACERADLVLVQGDTTTALAGALAAFNRRIPVGHVEAGLRSGNAHSPFPEEMNRRLISRLAAIHFAATTGNRDTLIGEGVDPATIFVTGNPVVDAVNSTLTDARAQSRVDTVLASLPGLKPLVLTTHRRESIGSYMTRSLAILRGFVDAHPDVGLLFPVHPNPAVVETATALLGGHPRIQLLEPLGYAEFVHLLSRAWLVVSDSGGLQEEAPSLAKPLIVLRENTERPEVIECGIGRLVGSSPERLRLLLEDAVHSNWIQDVHCSRNPFGAGDAGSRIVDILASYLLPEHRAPAVGSSIPALVH